MVLTIFHLQRIHTKVYFLVHKVLKSIERIMSHGFFWLVGWLVFICLLAWIFCLVCFFLGFLFVCLFLLIYTVILLLVTGIKMLFLSYCE